ncbi:MAG: rhomboid family intramembrane serine protease, partial [Bacteroidales bacterium]|nr:rhomboid family intramembrane serine protease [Bacteroidales bacterium]
MRLGLADEIKGIFRRRDYFRILIFINISVFVLILAINLFFYFAAKPSHVVDWLAIPSGLQVLGQRPWTVVTYMFAHTDFIHILFNLLAFYWFGQIFLEYFSQRQLLWVYILGGLAGALFFIVAYNIIPIFAPVRHLAVAVGASASIMAVIFAEAVLLPNLPIRLAFIGTLKLKYLALIMVLIDLLTIPLGNAGGHFAHIGGACMGMLFSLCYKKGTDITVPLSNFGAWFSKIFTRKKSMRYSKNKSVENFGKKNDKSAEIDKILDKIKVSGYSSLTKEEKELLFKNSGN